MSSFSSCSSSVNDEALVHNQKALDVHVVLDDSGSMYHLIGFMDCMLRELTLFQTRLHSDGIADVVFHVFSHIARSGRHLNMLLGLPLYLSSSYYYIFLCSLDPTYILLPHAC